VVNFEKAPTHIETTRLVLLQPQASDAASIFERYASDPDVTKFLGWPRHASVTDTQAFLRFSAAEWERWPAGPYLIRSRSDGRLLGGWSEIREFRLLGPAAILHEPAFFKDPPRCAVLWMAECMEPCHADSPSHVDNSPKSLSGIALPPSILRQHIAGGSSLRSFETEAGDGRRGGTLMANRHPRRKGSRRCRRGNRHRFALAA
jgi:hypothetical protein